MPTVIGMRSAAAALALGLTLTAAGLSSCATPDDPVQPPEPDPSVTPVYASEAEALAAAEELYGRYLGVENKLGQGGWKDLDQLSTVLTGAALDNEVESANSLAQKGFRQVGEAKFDSLKLQQLRDSGPGTVDITFYVCSDVSTVDVVNREGSSVVSADRPDRQPIEARATDRGGALKIVRRDAWSGDDFC